MGLGLGREIAVQGPQAQAPPRGQGFAAPEAGPDLRGAGQEDQRVVLETFGVEALQRIRDLQLDGAVVRAGQEGGLHRVGAAFTALHRRVQVGGHGAWIQGGGHDQELQVKAGLQLEAAQQGDGQVRVQVPLVELVQHDC